MTLRFIGPLLCGGLLALALTTEARAFWYIPGTDTCMKAGMVAKGNSCVERERPRAGQTIRNKRGGARAVPTESRDVTRNSNRMGGGTGTSKPKALRGEPPRGGPGPTDLSGRR
jgi:hypothetical protein